MRQDKDNKIETATNGQFYNTISESGQTLENSRKSAKSQEGLILKIFRSAEEKGELHGYESKLTASDVWAWYKVYNTSVLLTSIRRGITVLCNLDLLEKTEDMRMGMYGKNEHLYRLR